MMPEQTEMKSSMIRYLLGQMSDQERSNFEEQYQKDNDLFYALAELENDLIDLHALGALSDSEQEHMRHFLADPDRQKRLAFARTLVRYPEAGLESVPRDSPDSRTWWLSSRGSKRLALGVIAAAMVIGISWLLVANHGLKKELETLRTRQSGAEKEAQTLKRQVETLTHELEERGKTTEGIEQTPPLLAQNTVSFSLRSNVVRGEGPAPTLKIPARATFVVLELTLPAHAPSPYDLVLETADGNAIWRQAKLKSRSVDGLVTQLAIKLPSHILIDGDYVLRVTTPDHKHEDVAGYTFVVTHR
jgi:hypothetical protein